jgi:hypothetical protein
MKKPRHVAQNKTTQSLASHQSNQPLKRVSTRIGLASTNADLVVSRAVDTQLALAATTPMAAGLGGLGGVETEVAAPLVDLEGTTVGMLLHVRVGVLVATPGAMVLDGVWSGHCWSEVSGQSGMVAGAGTHFDVCGGRS